MIFFSSNERNFTIITSLPIRCFYCELPLARAPSTKTVVSRKLRKLAESPETQIGEDIVVPPFADMCKPLSCNLQE